MIIFFLMKHYRSDIPNYAVDTTTYNCGKTILEAMLDLWTKKGNLLYLFCYNNFKVNPCKCHLFFSLFNLKSININFFFFVEESSSKTFLGVTVGSSFTFDKNTNELCRKGNRNYIPLFDVLNTWLLRKSAL